MNVIQCDVCKRVIGGKEQYLRFKADFGGHPPVAMSSMSEILDLDVCDECIKKGFKIKSQSFDDPKSYLILIDTEQ